VTGTLNILKDAQPDHPQDFTFTTSFSRPFRLDDDGDASLPRQRLFDLPSGTYIVRETRTQGWISTVTCRSLTGRSAVSTDGTTLTATIVLAADDLVTCEFRNTRVVTDCLVTIKLLEIRYSSLLDDIGSEWEFDFMYALNGTRFRRDEFNLTLEFDKTHTFDPPREVSLVAEGRGGTEVHVFLLAQATELDLIDDVGLDFDSITEMCEPQTVPFSLSVIVRERPGRGAALLTFEFEIVLAVR
jgi:hypothetical protein